MSETKPHVHSISVFDCPRVMMVRDTENGCLTLKFGTITVNVYGVDPYKECPVIIEHASDRDLISAQNAEWLASLATGETR